MKYLITILFFLYASFSFSQTYDGLTKQVKIQNNSSENIYIAFAYIGDDVNKFKHKCYYSKGWFYLYAGQSTEITLDTHNQPYIYFHAHSTTDKNHSWGKEKDFLVHPINSFHIKNAESFDKAETITLYRQKDILQEGSVLYKFSKIKYSEQQQQYNLILQ